MARSGSCHFSRVSRLAETGSYGEWQDPDLATFNGLNSGKIQILPFLMGRRVARSGSCHILECEVARSGSCHFQWLKEWQDPDLATFKGSRDRLKPEAMGSGKIWILPYFIVWSGKIRILPLLMGEGLARSGSCHISEGEVARFGARSKILPLFLCKNGKIPGKIHV